METNNLHTQVILGAMTGDSIGAHVEFRQGSFSKAILSDAMAMKAGGTHGTASGQITDDGELALGMLRTLHKNSCYIVADVISEYKKWVSSNPFDIGNTTATALRFPQCKTHEQIQYVRCNNGKGEANGALMRQSPLIAFATKFETWENHIQLAMTDASITHGSDACLVASAFYNMLGRYLIKEKSSRLDSKQMTQGEFLEWCFDHAIKKTNEACEAKDLDMSALLKIEEAYNHIKNGESLPECHGWDQGHYLVAIKCTLWALFNAKSWDDGIESIIHQGGDTDTNACIAGALLAIIHEVPEWRSKLVSECDLTQGVARPKEWRTGGNLSRYLTAFA